MFDPDGSWDDRWKLITFNIQIPKTTKKISMKIEYNKANTSIALFMELND